MSQLNFYVPDELEEQIRKAAQEQGKSISAFLADLIRARFSAQGWSEDFFAALGQWEGDFPEIERSLPQEREKL